MSIAALSSNPVELRQNKAVNAIRLANPNDLDGRSLCSNSM